MSSGFAGSVISNRSTSSTSSLSIAATYASSPASHAMALWDSLARFPWTSKSPNAWTRRTGLVGSSMS
jgi:hypothetical protein